MSFCSMAPPLWNQKVFRTSKGPALTVESLYDPSNGLHYFVINHYGVHHELYIATRPGWNNLKIEVSTQKIALYNNDTFQLDHEINTRSLNISYSRKYVYSTRPVLLNWFIQRKNTLISWFWADSPLGVTLGVMLRLHYVLVGHPMYEWLKMRI